MQKFRKKENVVRKPFIVCFGAHSGLTAEVFCDTITCKQRKEVEKIMHRFIQTFVKIFVLATALCVFAGCTPADLSSAKDDPDTTVITARRKNAQTELTETLADEKDKLPFFTGSTERIAESTTSEPAAETETTACAVGGSSYGNFFPHGTAGFGRLCLQYKQQEVPPAKLRFRQDDQRQEPRKL